MQESQQLLQSQAVCIMSSEAAFRAVSMGTALHLATWSGSCSMQSCPSQVVLCGLKQNHHRLTLRLR